MHWEFHVTHSEVAEVLEPMSPREAMRGDRRGSVAWDRRRRQVSAALLPFPDRRDPLRPDRRQPAPRGDADGFDPQPLDGVMERMLGEPDLDALVNAEPRLAQAVTERTRQLVQAAWQDGDAAALVEAHGALYQLLGQAFASPLRKGCFNHQHPLLAWVRRALESAWEGHLERSVGPQVDHALAEGRDFASSFLAFCQQHRLARHPFFDFVERRATPGQLVQFLLHDSAVVLKFFDLLSLTLVGADEEIRRELVANLVDEVGGEGADLRHTDLFRNLLHYVGVDDGRMEAHARAFHRHASWQCLAGHNLYLLLGLQRSNYFRSLGCLGSAEVMDVGQYLKISRGCRRVGWSDPDALRYYDNHALVDVGHGQGWLDRVMQPLVDKHPGAAREFLMGTAMRLETAAQCYDALLAAMLEEEALKASAGSR